MRVTLWHRIGSQFRHPSGRFGRVMGTLMRFANRTPNRLAIEALRLSAADHVLELGCGPGAALAKMSAMASRGIVHGLDQSETMLEQARQANAQGIASGRVTLHRASFDRLPLGDASVDRVLAVNVIYFWTDPVAVLAEIHRVLRPGGRVAIYATDAANMRKWPFAGPETHRLFDTNSLAATLRDSAFRFADITVSQAKAGPGVLGLLATMSI